VIVGGASADAAGSDVRARREGVRRHLRGSSLLLAGRLASLGINLAVQVLTVRSLARDEYGAFAWALVVVGGATQLVLLGLDTTVARFVAIYHERGEPARVFGAIALSAGGIALTGLLLIGGAFAAAGALPDLLGAEPAAVTMLLAMVAMAPLQALDSMLHALYGVFGRARAIMVRRHLVGPGLKLASVVAVIALGGGAYELALAYVASLLAGVTVYAALLVQLLRRDGHFERWRPRRLEVPARQMLGFAASLLTAELVFLFHSSFVTMLLQYHHDADAVAGFQAARPFAKLIDVAFVTFAHLFVPALARFHARGDREGVEHLYGQTCVWVALLSFPLFALTFATADSLAPWLLGREYEDAGSLLAWMSLGFFAHSVLGVNGHAVRVLGFVRTAVATDLLTVAAALAIGFALIPSGGALGAALALALLLAVRGLLHLAVLGWRSGLHPLRRHASVHLAILGATLALVLARPFTSGSLVGSALVAAAAVLAVLVHARRRIALAETFPELARLPLPRRLWGSPPGRA
jgi:O-antigen/teichoic acid export membrane protein